MEKNTFISTKEMAAIFRVEPGTIRRAYCVGGNYLGLKPRKLSNKRLLWSKVETESVLKGTAQL